MEYFSTLPSEAWIILGILAVIFIVTVPEFLFALIILVMVSPYVMVYTAKYESIPTDNDCRHVVVTTFGGLVTNIDTVLCGDEEINFGNKSITIEPEPG